MDYIIYPTLVQTDGTDIQLVDNSNILLTNSLTDAQFLQWLRDQSSRVMVIAEINFGYQNAGMPAEGTLYHAERPYTSELVGSTIQYAATIESGLSFQRSIDVTQLGGQGTASIGSLVLSNSDGNLDYLMFYILDGRDVNFFIGDPTWERSQFRQIGLGNIVSIKADDDTKLTLTLRDKGLLLDATIIGDTMTVGPNIGKPKPVLFGQNYNFDLTPYLFDVTGPTYYYNNYAQDPNLAVANVIVRDQGVSLVNVTGFSGTNAAITASGNTISYTNHGQLAGNVIVFSGTSIFAGLTIGTQYYVLAGSLTANNFQLSLTPGGSVVALSGTTFSGTLAVSSRRYYVNASAASITLSSPPNGQVTADILSQGPSGDSAIQNIPHAAFRYILDTWTRLTSSNRDANAFSALVAAEQASGAQWGCAVLDRTNVLDVLDKIAVATNSWYAWNRTGLLTVGQLDLVNLDSQTAIDSIVASDISGDPSYENLGLPFGKIILDADANVVTQTSGMATSVSAADKSKYSQPYQTRVKTTDPGTAQYLTEWCNYHKTAIDSQPLETAYVGNTAAVQALCDARTALFQPYTSVFTCTVGLDKYLLDIGSVVSVIYPRYSLNSGKNFRVASINMRPGDREIDLTLVRRNIPNWDALGVGTTVPGAPTIGTAVKFNLKATVAFTAPASNGGANITSYTATSSPGGFTATGTASPLTVTGLSNGTAYTFTVTATNSVGTSAASAASNSVTPSSTVPDVPTTVAAVVASATSATVTFAAPADNGGSAVTGYTVTSVPAGGTDSNAGSTGLSHTITGLTSGTTYTFTVHATNANGNSAESTASNAITPGNRQIALTISSSNHTGYNVFTAASSPADPVDVTLTINSGCDVDCQTSGTYALYGGNGWAAGSTLKIINNGYILGLGGTGAAGNGSSGNGANGGDGQCAIYMTVPTTIDNTNGFIFSGGGGGCSGGFHAGVNGGSGGGGAGYGQRSGYDADYGGRLTGGSGGTLGGFSGGNGGNSASAGGSSFFVSGGAPGNAILLNGNAITWIGGNDGPTGIHVKGVVS